MQRDRSLALAFGGLAAMVLFFSQTAADDALGPLQTRCIGHADVCDGRRVADYIRQGPAGRFAPAES